MATNRFIRFIPNLFTLGNLFLGCLGIIFTFNDHIFPIETKGDESIQGNYAILFGLNNRLYLASFMIFGAAVLDFFDALSPACLKHNRLSVYSSIPRGHGYFRSVAWLYLLSINCCSIPASNEFHRPIDCVYATCFPRFDGVCLPAGEI
jgi:hypothetical protein